MKKETHDDVVSYTDLFTDENGLVWNFLIRPGGSISLYATNTGCYAHDVAFDTLDGQPPNEAAQKVIARLVEIGEGIDRLMSVAIPVSS